jgi:flagellar biosynthesis protein FlhA
VQKLLKDLPAEQKKLVDDLIPSVISATTVQRVLQALLRERVSIRDLPAILEGIGEAAPPHQRRQPGRAVRAKLGRQLCWQHRGDDGALPIITLSPDGSRPSPTPWSARRGPPAGARALAPAGVHPPGPRRLRARRLAGDAAVLLTSPIIRPYVRSIIERFRGQTTVMSQSEIHPRARLRTVGTV